jgi:putative ABC transport system permease protein
MIDLIQEIYSTLRRNRLRTFLTGFAVSWGIFILIVLLGAGNGLLHAMMQNWEGMAMNVIKVYSGHTTLPYKGLKEGRRIELTNREIALTQSLVDHVERAGGKVFAGDLTLSHGKEHLTRFAEGVIEGYTRTESLRLTHGRDINHIDVDQRRKVVVIHEKTAQVLYKDEIRRAGGHLEAAVGQYLQISGTVYRVVGLYQDNSFGQPSVYMPFTTLQTLFNRGDKLYQIVVETKGLTTAQECEAFVQEMRRELAAHKQFDPSDTGALWFNDRFSQMVSMQQGTDILRQAIWIIGLFTLLSGIVGVSNIMLITVKERTREFGIRKALGARPASILWLIITESIAITALFGYLGMVAGIAATEYMNATLGGASVDIGIGSQTYFVDPTVDIGVAIRATVTLVVAGTLAGFFPARKAVKIKPIEALAARD